MKDPIRRVLRSEWVWRMTGLSYPTAVYATSGHIRTLSDYLAFGQAEMKPLLPLFPPGGIFLEFGSGLGRNLFAVSELAGKAYGLDNNPLYVRLARRIAKRLGKANIDFQTYDGSAIPKFQFQPDVVFSIGVFERLPHDQVAGYVADLTALLRPGGMAILYFLAARSAETGFVRRLGPDAYFYWDRKEVETLLKSCQIKARSVLPWGLCRRPNGAGSLTVADVYAGVKEKS